MNWRVVIQKYIENPMIVKKKKFDIRQWIVVTSWEPLVVWGFSEPYARFCTADYNAKRVKDKYAHLANRSVQKHAVG